MDSPATSTEVDGDEDLLEFLGDCDFIIDSTHTYYRIHIQITDTALDTTAPLIQYAIIRLFASLG